MAEKKLLEHGTIESEMTENITRYYFSNVGKDRIRIRMGTLVNTITITLKKADAKNFAKELYDASSRKGHPGIEE